LRADVGAPIDGGIRLVACCAGTVFASAAHIEEAGSSLGKLGVVDEVGKWRLGGWAIDLHRPDRPVTVDVRLGALWIGAAQTLIPRRDIQARFSVSQPSGFSYSIPAPLRSARLGALRLFIANTDIELAGSPLTAR
jgi:hypothetical protein